MKQQKTPEFTKSSWLRDIIKESTPQIAAIQITTTIIFTISIAFFIMILGVFINNRIKEFLVSEEDYFVPPNNMSSYSLGRSIQRVEFSDWIAPTELWHSMSDEELVWRASMAPGIKDYPYNRTPKVAFMFLTRNSLPLAPLWELFFKGHQGFYSIYVHNSSEFINEPLESSVFYKRRIPSQGVEWGRSSMVDAERRLLANALLDFSNERFILLSESCIPLFNFTITYKYLINSKHSYIGSFDDPRNVGRGRYNKRMAPTILLSDWRKGSQWFELHRELAISIISDKTFYNVIRDHCKPPCYMDEHYFATLVAKIGNDLNSNRSVTWVDWSRPGSHPTTFVRRDISEEFFIRVRGQIECVYNNISGSLCFIFARKFHPNTLEPLLKLSPVLYGVNP
ncbi:glycosyltransferase BC10-like [Silene latifolia]|uniref:glycosyltransferase BC10-like n=1 Tax=Silene latifolia TaxID=37657 RepID=UPI003D773D58